MNAAMLRVEDLRVSYDHPRGAVRAVDDVSFSLGAQSGSDSRANPAPANRPWHSPSCA